ncbi:PEP-CTERM sorting domain-containing protein [Oceaniferula marina]|nr:PEP-CTERM sorting domain-containing protein [Oceaniferula marina]
MKYTMAVMAITTMASHAALILEYDASLGTNPSAQGWTHYEILEGSIAAGAANMEAGVVDGSDTVLHMNDQNADGTLNLPAFAKDRSTAQDQDMFDNGMQMTVVAKNLGGWFIGFGFNGTVFMDADNIGSDKRIGFNLNSAANDGAYHTFVVNGALDGSNNYNFTLSIDGGTPTAMAIQSNSAPTAYDQGLYLSGGSSSGTSGEAMFKSVVVESVPEPSSAALLGLGGIALILRRRK